MPRPTSALDTGAVVTKPLLSVISLQVGVSHFHATESPPSVIFHSDPVTQIFIDWRRLIFFI